MGTPRTRGTSKKGKPQRAPSLAAWMPPRPASSEVTNEMECVQILAPPAHQRKQIPLVSSQRTLCRTSVPSVLNLFFACWALRRARDSPSLLKIKIQMPLAPRIKPRPASRAPRLAIQILPNRHLRPASPTQNRPLLALPSRPNRNRMPRQRNMAILASIVDPTTPHLDRHNIHRRAVMHASRLPINLDPAHLWTLFSENDVPLLSPWWKPGLLLRGGGPL